MNSNNRIINITGIESVAADGAGGSRVGSLSIGGGASTSVDAAVAAAVAAGAVMSVAAGNSNSNACNYSPAREPTVSLKSYHCLLNVVSGDMCPKQEAGRSCPLSPSTTAYNI